MSSSLFLFFFNDTATTEIYTLSLHTLFRSGCEIQRRTGAARGQLSRFHLRNAQSRCEEDRKSTRLNSSHEWISYAVFCLKKKKKQKPAITYRQKHLSSRATTATSH